MEGHHKTELKKNSKKKKIFFFFNSSGRVASISGTVVNPGGLVGDMKGTELTSAFVRIILIYFRHIRKS